jgi:hypothetical protein
MHATVDQYFDTPEVQIIEQDLFINDYSIYIQFLAYIPYFDKIKRGLLDHLPVCVYVCACPSI